VEGNGSSANALWPTLENLARPAREKRRLAPAQRDRLIMELCARAALSVRELAQLIDRTEAYTGDAIRPLIERKQLAFLYPDQPRHPKQRYLTPGSAAAEEAERVRATENQRFAPPAVADTDTSIAQPGPNESPAVAAAEEVTRVIDNGDADMLATLAQSRWAELEQVGRQARENRDLTAVELAEVIERIAALAPVSTRELSILTDRREDSIAEILDGLLSRARLGFLFPDDPAHPRQKYFSVYVGRALPDAAQQSTPAFAARAAAERPLASAPAIVGFESAPTDSRLPNATTNLTVAAVTGLLLGVSRPAGWWLYGLVVGVTLAALHVVTDSKQFRRYQALDSSRTRTMSFVFFKALVAYIEITAVVLLVSLFV
jgi:hypothetical protein